MAQPCQCSSTPVVRTESGLGALARRGLRGGLGQIILDPKVFQAPLIYWAQENPTHALADLAQPEAAAAAGGTPYDQLQVELASYDGGTSSGIPVRFKLGDGPWTEVPSEAQRRVTVPPMAIGGRRTWGILWGAASAAAMAASAYHGWRRTRSAGWTAGWVLFGALFPVIAVPVAFAQGFGKRKKS